VLNWTETYQFHLNPIIHHPWRVIFMTHFVALISDCFGQVAR
jgi:hypothetical protein